MRHSIFHEPWWLDALAPGRWREVTCVQGGRTIGVLRFVERREGRMKICTMPDITRFLGPLVVHQSGRAEARNRTSHAVISELLEHVADFDHVAMTLDNEVLDVSPFLHAGYEVRAHPTFILDCSRPPDDLWSGLRDKVRNVIRRARDRLAVEEVEDVALFTEFYVANLAGEEAYFDLSLLGPAIGAARAHGRCRILAARDERGMAHAMAVFVWDAKYVYYFLSSRARDDAHAGAVSLLVWSGIELACAKGLRLDFDGGITKDARYKFLVGFGGELANRFDVSRSTPLFQLQSTLRRVPRAVARRVAARVPEAPVETAIARGRQAIAGMRTSIGPLAQRIGGLPPLRSALANPVVREAVQRLPGGSRLLSHLAPESPWQRRHPFDALHGTDTSGLVPVGKLAGVVDEHARSEAIPYAGSQPSIIRSALAGLGPLDTFTFIDLGCGKGRPLLVASEFPFRGIVGVELSGELATMARRNAAVIRQRHPERPPIRIETADAARYVLPAGNLVIFLYNPFGAPVVAKVAKAIEAALLTAARTIYVVYYNPVAGACFDAIASLRRHSAATLPYAAEELGFGPDTDDPIVVWQGGIVQSGPVPGADAAIEIVDPKYRVRLLRSKQPAPERQLVTLAACVAFAGLTAEA